MAYRYDVEAIREEEYPNMKGGVYLDHGGTTIYSKSLIDKSHRTLTLNLYGNPHSASNSARLSSQAVDEVREKTLRFFNADPDHFDLIFTANATAAIKLVGDAFRDLASSSSTSGAFWYGYHKDAHTSLVGLRQYTKSHTCFASDQAVEKWLETGDAPDWSPEKPTLFAFPGQSNMTGRRLPLSWVNRLRQSRFSAHQKTYTLLDAAALVSTGVLDLSDHENTPDFIAMSFYKIFGYPDLGALIVRRKWGHILTWKKYFGGGTVNMITVLHEAEFKRKEDILHEGMEDGTLPFHSIIQLGCAIDVHRELYGRNCMKAISAHTTALIHRLYQGLSSLHYRSGQPLCNIYYDNSDAPYCNSKTQGATVAFNVMKPDGSYVAYSVVERMANDQKIYLRTGGLCNPGGVATYLGFEPWQFKHAWSAGHKCGDSGDTEIIQGKPTGVVRASLGAMSTVREVDIFLHFMARTFLDRSDLRERPGTARERKPLILVTGRNQWNEQQHSSGMPLDINDRRHDSGIDPGDDWLGSRPQSHSTTDEEVIAVASMIHQYADAQVMPEMPRQTFATHPFTENIENSCAILPKPMAREHPGLRRPSSLTGLRGPKATLSAKRSMLLLNNHARDGDEKSPVKLPADRLALTKGFQLPMYADDSPYSQAKFQQSPRSGSTSRSTSVEHMNNLRTFQLRPDYHPESMVKSEKEKSSISKRFWNLKKRD